MPLSNLLEETLDHFKEGAKCVTAFAPNETYIITKVTDQEYWVTLEAPGFPKSKTDSLQSYFEQVFGIEAKY